MKRFLNVLVAILLCITIVFISYCIADNKNKDVENGNANLTTVTKAPVTEKGSDRVLINTLEDGDDKFELYQRGTDNILVHNGKEFEFYDWSKYITLEKPEMYYGNYDYNPDDKELVIRVVSSTNLETGGYIYDIYLLNIFEDKNGEEQMDLAVASEGTWRSILNNEIKAELSQPSYCDKFVQIAMTYAWDKNITYNNDGIANSIYRNYAHALKDGKGGYLETDRWSYGQGYYFFDKEDQSIAVKIDVKVNYKGTDIVQNLGYIRCKLYVNDFNRFVVRPKSLNFKANDEYKSLKPTKKRTADKNWTYVENNTDQSISNIGDKNIDWIKYTFRYDPSMNEKAVSYNNNETEMKNVSKLVFDKDKIKLYAKSGYTFDKNAAETGDFKIVINEETAPSSKQYEISYKANITQEDGVEVLTIDFEHDYPQDFYQSLTIYYNTES